MNLRLFYDPSIGASVGSGAASGASLGSIIPGWGTVVGGLVGAGAGLISGIIQKNKAKSLFAQNQYPTQAIPEDLLYNQQQARNMANEGLPSQQYQQGKKNIERQQLYAMRQASDRRMAGGLINATQQTAGDQFGNLDVGNAQARVANQRYAMGINSQVAAARQSAFDWNQKNRYQQNYNYAMGLLGAGNANIIHGIDSATAAFMYGGNGLFGRRSGGTSGMADVRASPSASSYLNMQPQYSGSIGSNRYNLIS